MLSLWDKEKSAVTGKAGLSSQRRAPGPGRQTETSALSFHHPTLNEMYYLKVKIILKIITAI